MRSLLAVLLTLLVVPAVRAQALDGKAIDEVVQDALKAWEAPGCAVVVVRNDRVIYLKGHGLRKLGGPDPVTADTTFAIASCTKAFTSLLLAQLADDGKLSWDDPVRKHLPGFRLADPLADSHVTLRDLLCHRTGVASHDLLVYRAPWGLDEQVRRIGLVRPSKSFRSAFQYQSIMWVAAGQAAAAAGKSPYGALIEERIFKPLGMAGASLTTAAARQSADCAQPHRRDAQGKVTPVDWYDFTEPNPAASVHLSARDLGKWLQFQLGDGTWRGQRLVSAANLAETHTPQMVIRLEGLTRAEHPFTTQMNYGLGWVVQDYRGGQLISHAGVIDGMRAHVTLAPQARLGIGILTNLHRTRMNLALSNTLVDRLLGLPVRDWNEYYRNLVKAEEDAEQAAQRQRQAQRRPDTKPTLPLDRYAGVYENPAYGSARIVVDNGQLRWEWSTFRLPLEHFHYDTFTAEHEAMGRLDVTFTLNARGVVAALHCLEREFKRGALGRDD